WVGILTCELHFPEAHSLKEKRHHLRSAKAQLQNRVGASVAEVEHHDVWQRARITAACVAREHREVERLLDEAERWLRGQEWEIALAERLFVDPEDEEGRADARRRADRAKAERRRGAGGGLAPLRRRLRGRGGSRLPGGGAADGDL